MMMEIYQQCAEWLENMGTDATTNELRIRQHRTTDSSVAVSFNCFLVSVDL